MRHYLHSPLPGWTAVASAVYISLRRSSCPKPLVFANAYTATPSRYTDKRMPATKKRASYRQWRLCAINEGLSSFFKEYSSEEQYALYGLWQNWKNILGEEIAELGVPLGHKDNTLIIGADDNMAMQELSMMSPDILERVNDYMRCDFFRKISVVLMQGRRNLAQKRPRRSIEPLQPPLPNRPLRLGGLRGKLDSASPVADCYEAYLAMFEKG